jgi:acetyl/propionyl-CoA carboxylase alpha subunit
METLLIANRGEIAVRVLRTAHDLGLRTVAVYTDPDATAPHVTAADQAVLVPSYTDAGAIIAAATRTGADTIHPGYGFLSENPDFARAVIAAGLTFVGPPAEAIAAMGGKIAAKRRMADAGVPVLPSDGFPLLIKASAGGGGRGMRLVRSAAELADAEAAAGAEAAASFGDPTVFRERYLPDARHVEVQIVGDTHGEVAHLFERECSIQRRYQKVVEEAPSPAVDAELRAALGAAAVAAGKAIGYSGVGTVEFVLAADGAFYFLEMNTRLQVEHPVTELVTGLDLVALQLLIAGGEPLPPAVREARLDGYAIEARVYAEDPRDDFRPVTGTLHRFAIEAGAGVRVDTGYRDGSVVSPHYDGLLAKVIGHGRTREEAARRLARALRAAEIHGVPTNRDLLLGILSEEDFRAGRTDTGYLTRHEPASLVAPAPETHALVAALARRAENRAAAPVLRTLPAGWRNVRSAPPRVAFDGFEVVGSSTVNGRSLGEVAVHSATPSTVDLSVDGIRRLYRINRCAGVYYVDGGDGSSVLTPTPRFPEPIADGAGGSLVAPMPGTVVEVLVKAGDPVRSGQPLLVLEAMKMRQTITAPADGTLTELRASVGGQVDTGAILAVVA